MEDTGHRPISSSPKRHRPRSSTSPSTSSPLCYSFDRSIHLLPPVLPSSSIPRRVSGPVQSADAAPASKLGSDLPKQPSLLNITKPFTDLLNRPRSTSWGSYISSTLSQTLSFTNTKSIPTLPRTITLDPMVLNPPINPITNKPFISNKITTARYTPLTFVPYQLYAQFSKIANLYFLFVAAIQMVPGWSPTGQYTTILPLAIFMGIAISREGYDDLRRHRDDRQENGQYGRVLRWGGRQAPRSVSWLQRQVNEVVARVREPVVESVPVDPSIPPTWLETRWEDMQVGDIVRIDKDEWIPADVLVLWSSNADEQCHVETAALDGETNLKQRSALAPRLPQVGFASPEGLSTLTGIVGTETPNNDLYNFDGYFEEPSGKRLPLTVQNILLRGTLLRNTHCVHGLILSTGEDTKIRQNANRNIRTKAPTLQRQVNKVIIIIFTFLILLSGIFTGLSLNWQHKNITRMWYLDLVHHTQDPAQTVFQFIILFNTVIPISLYVTMEIVKLAQAYFIGQDVTMYYDPPQTGDDHPVQGTPARALTSTINEELGQVDIVFSDKTGTLTDNVMQFRKCSVGGWAYVHEEQPTASRSPAVDEEQRMADAEWQEVKDGGNVSIKWSHTIAIDTPGRRRSIRDTLRHSLHQVKEHWYRHPSPVGGEEVELVTAMGGAELAQVKTSRRPMMTSNESDVTEVFSADSKSVRKDASLLRSLSPSELVPDRHPRPTSLGATVSLQTQIHDGANQTPFVQRARFFLLAIALCHTVLPEVTADGSLKYQAASPDEYALVSAAKELGFVVLERSHRKLVVCSTHEDAQVKHTFEILDLIEFTSKRKRQSVIVRLPDGRIVLLCKGADTTILERVLKPNHDKEGIDQTASTMDEVVGDVDPIASAAAYRDPPLGDEAWEYARTLQHIQQFATDGLRTLLYAHRFLSPQEYTHWNRAYTEANMALRDRQIRVEQVAEDIEVNMRLTGATAIEDKLQQGVPDAIDRLRRAGMKIWMLTGDKRETAINIGHSCKLIRDDSKVIILDREMNLPDVLTHALSTLHAKVSHTVLVVDGATLGQLEDDTELMSLFCRVGCLCESVICCRVSPSQKALVVRSMRVTVPKAVTLAIGDGGNDIAMIQEAHVGIGIAGKEGMQAARSADYSIGQFRFLCTLLFVHGHWSYIRVSTFVLGTFYKCMVFYMTQAVYQCFDGFTGTSLYEGWTLSMYNTLFSSLPVIFLGIFEQDLKRATLIANPERYRIGQRNGAFNLAIFAEWILTAWVHAIVCALVPLATMGSFNVELEFGSLGTPQIYTVGVMGYLSVVIVVTTKIAYVENHNQTFLTHITAWLEIGAFLLYQIIYNFAYPLKYSREYAVHGAFIYTARNPSFWAIVIITCAICYLVSIPFFLIKRFFSTDALREFQIAEKNPAIMAAWQKEADAQIKGIVL